VGISVDDAFTALRDYARAGNRKFRDVASAVIDGSMDIAALPAPMADRPQS
jgi:hypothetical protein